MAEILEEVKVRIPDTIRKELKMITETGYYENEEEFIIEAIKTLLIARKDLRVEIACRMFQKREVSLGKAMEISGLDIEKMKKALEGRGIKRASDESIKEIKSASTELLKRARGSTP